jgi:hypothetical protein
MGHGAPASWTQESVITTQIVNAGLFNNASRPTAVWHLGCYGTYFVDPRYNTVAHALMLQSNGGGASMVLGPSALTEVNHDIAWLNALTEEIGRERVGDAVKKAQRRMSTSGNGYIDISIGGTLLGDPAMRLKQR